MKKTKLVACSIGLALLLAGCNTMRGIGQDIEKGGEVIQKAASR